MAQDIASNSNWLVYRSMSLTGSYIRICLFLLISAMTRDVCPTMADSPMLLAITGISVTMFIHRQHKDACVMNQYVLFFSDG